MPTHDHGAFLDAGKHCFACLSVSRRADGLPVLIVDTREQAPLAFVRLPSCRGTLATGDYSIRGMEHRFAVERKSIPDLVACCGRERDRFTAELARLAGIDFRRLLIIGTESEIIESRYRSEIAPAAVMGSLHAWEARYNVPVVFSDNPASGADLVETWAYYYTREIIRRADTLALQPGAG